MKKFENISSLLVSCLPNVDLASVCCLTLQAPHAQHKNIDKMSARKCAECGEVHLAGANG